MLPGQLRAMLGEDAARTWETLAAALPTALYLGGGIALTAHLHHRASRDLDFFYHEHAVDLDLLAGELAQLGSFAITQRAPGTLSGVFSSTKLQFLHADEIASQHRLEATTSIAGINVAGIADILAMKLKVIAERGELRDYFDIKVIEQRTGRMVEEGLGLFMARYALEPEAHVLEPIVRALGYLDDVDADALVPESKREVAAYWAARQPQILRSLGRG